MIGDLSALFYVMFGFGIALGFVIFEGIPWLYQQILDLEAELAECQKQGFTAETTEPKE